MNTSEKAAQFLSETFDDHMEDLKALVRIPSVSFPGFDPAHVKASAQAVATLLKKRGFENVELLELPGAHPYVYADYIHAPNAPTVLLYAHHDVQPPGREEIWNTPAFEPVFKEGPGGIRMFGRGAADDKAGVILHTAAVFSWLKTVGSLPLNVKVVIEGEEEVGSNNLMEFLTKYRTRLSADALILTDTMNFDCGIPALTVALRGLVAVEVEVRGLKGTVHSGMWGGPVPDPTMALCKLLSTLITESGQINISEIRAMVKSVSKEEEIELKRVPYDEVEFRKQSGMVPGAQIHFEGPSPAVQIWRFPSLTINGIQAASRKQCGNVINDTAWARLSIRLVDGMEPKNVLNALETHLKKNIPWGLELTVKREEGGAAAWSTEPKGPAFEAAKTAMFKGYGKAPYMIGCGGTIPFVTPFAEALGGVPALLVGVEDPYTNAHGENESVLVSDLKKGALTMIYLFEELAKNLVKK